MTAWLSDLVLEAALRALVFAAAVGLALSILRVRNVPVRKAAWTLVLLASLAMPLLMRAVPARFGWNLHMPALLVPTRPIATQHAAASVAAPAVLQARAIEPTPTFVTDSTPPAATSNAIDLAPVPSAFTASAANPAPKFHGPSLQSLIVWTYLAVAAALLLRLLIGLAAALRLWITAAPVSPLIAPEPSVRSSSRITSPVNIGSGIVLPADYALWPMHKVRMVLAHERSHVRQMDFYLQLLAGLYTAIFWFSPLGWWLRRTLSVLGETIGDRAGMEAAASRTRYAEVVLEFAALAQRSLPGVAMAQTGNVSRRIERMLNETWLRIAFAEGRRRALVSLLVIPAALFVVVALVRVPAAGAQSAPPPPPSAPSSAPNPAAAPNPAPAPNPDAAPTSGQAFPDQGPDSAQVVGPAPADAAPALPKVVPMPPLDTVAPLPPPTIDVEQATGEGVRQSDTTTVTNSNSYSTKGYAWHFSNNGESWAVVRGSGNDLTFSGSWNGDQQEQLKKARAMANGPFLWFMHDGKSYIVTDPAILASIQKMAEPIRALGAQQEALGKQQEVLGKQEEALARDAQLSIKVRLPDLSKEMADLNATMAKMKTEQFTIDTQKFADLEAKIKAETDQELSPQKLAELQRNLAAVQAQWNSQFTAQFDARMAELQARLGALEGAAGAREGQFGEQEGKLGEQQGKLGEQQGRIGEQQGKLSEDMDRQVQKIIRDALASGKAQPVH